VKKGKEEGETDNDRVEKYEEEGNNVEK